MRTLHNEAQQLIYAAIPTVEQKQIRKKLWHIQLNLAKVSRGTDGYLTLIGQLSSLSLQIAHLSIDESELTIRLVRISAMKLKIARIGHAQTSEVCDLICEVYKSKTHPSQLVAK